MMIHVLRLNLVVLTVLTVAAVLPFQAGFASAPDGPSPDPQVVEITAVDYAFRAPDVIPSGWTTIRFKNDGEESHFVLLSRLPEGLTSDDYEHDLSVQFNEVWEALRDGEVDQEGAFEMLGARLPAWYPDIRFLSGPGFMAPGLTSESTVYLEPGTYVLECYMKTKEGVVHFMEGMMRPLVVTDEPSGAAPPEADVRITLSNYEMAVDGEFTPGRHTIEVYVAENPEQGFGHSAHVARLNADTDVDEVVQWMNWFGLQGMRMPAPVEFLGGAHQMPVGQKAYFTVDLEPGRYLLISEATAHQGVLKEFTVAP